MAKALIGYMDSDLRTPAHLTAENARLRARVRELEELVLSLKKENDSLEKENDSLVEANAADLVNTPMQEMQPA
jgi:cell division protein FtsB